ncbi:hypothetical protein HHK36_014316 [Tetracentron sinense]|uniref:Nuclease HARBI1 n=1 Tax=Tetracentron sinense TaxID=13715 RepID=A0A835DE47_TETSI|nr:hypothetical protein HHK36_014316 [Tetracentron sinense]
MDRILPNAILHEDSDDELDSLTIACMEEERLHKEKLSRRRRGSVQGHREVLNATSSFFLRIQHVVEAYDPYFVQKIDAIGMFSLSSLQKITVAMRMLAYRVAADCVDEYVRIGESTVIESLQKFIQVVVAIFSDEYLRPPNNDDIARLLAVGENRRFPGMLGIIDCMHWKLKNCPTVWKGMYSGYVRERTIILEVVVSYDIWIWHAFFGLPGSHNDINVLKRSSVFTDLADGRAAAVNYLINGNDYDMGYYLADGIYPQWSTFVKTISSPQGNKQQYFVAAQESARNDVERAFEKNRDKCRKGRRSKLLLKRRQWRTLCYKYE